jgi:hypothetical protein
VTKPNYKKLQSTIAKGDGRSIESRWAYGRAILDDPKKISSSGKSLRHGALEALIADAKSVGSVISEREIQRRLQCARAYKSINQIRRLPSDLGTWDALCEAGFPAVEIDEEDPIDQIGDLNAEPDWEQPLLIPGLKHELKLNKQVIPISTAVVADGEAYEQMCVEMHEGFGKTVDQVKESMRIARLGADGDRGMLLTEAYERGLEILSGDEPEAEQDEESP